MLVAFEFGEPTMYMRPRVHQSISPLRDEKKRLRDAIARDAVLETLYCDCQYAQCDTNT